MPAIEPHVTSADERRRAEQTLRLRNVDSLAGEVRVRDPGQPDDVLGQRPAEILQRAGLVTSEKIGRTVVYGAVTAPVDALGDFLAPVRSRARRD